MVFNEFGIDTYFDGINLYFIRMRCGAERDEKS